MQKKSSKQTNKSVNGNCCLSHKSSGLSRGFLLVLGAALIFFALAIFTKMYLRSDDELIKIRVSTFREGDDFEQHATSQ